MLKWFLNLRENLTVAFGSIDTRLNEIEEALNIIGVKRPAKKSDLMKATSRLPIHNEAIWFKQIHNRLSALEEKAEKN